MEKNDVDIREIIKQLQEKRREILITLAPELLAEYHSISKRIRNLKAELKDPPLPKQAKGFFGAPRIPLLRHKRTLIEFLRSRGPSTRREIVTGTGIPTGSLWSLLKAKEFVQVERGLWGIKEGVR